MRASEPEHVFTATFNVHEELSPEMSRHMEVLRAIREEGRKCRIVTVIYGVAIILTLFIL